MQEIFPRTLGGRFRLESKLGQGGMGVVYAARDLAMDRPVAIKVVTPDPDVEDEVIARFLREARTTARITHPNIVHVYDLGRGDDGELFFVMERLAGVSLSEALRKTPRFEPQRAVALAIDICHALAHAHELGIIHRDLKPANVMIVPRDDGTEFAKVLDFGVAKAQDQGTQLTRTGMLVGTVEYMAPEQIRGVPVDARADIYALGVMLYRLLTGAPLFREVAVPMIIKSHISATPEPLRKRAPSAAISASLEAAVLKCLAKVPDGRFATMEELAETLALAVMEPLEGSESDERDPSWEPTRVGTVSDNAVPLEQFEATRNERRRPSKQPSRSSPAYETPRAPARPPRRSHASAPDFPASESARPAKPIVPLKLTDFDTAFTQAEADGVDASMAGPSGTIVMPGVPREPTPSPAGSAGGRGAADLEDATLQLGTASPKQRYAHPIAVAPHAVAARTHVQSGHTSPLAAPRAVAAASDGRRTWVVLAIVGALVVMCTLGAFVILVLR